MSAPPLRVRIPVVPGRGHNLYMEWIERPPEGVEYVHPRVGDVGYLEARDERPSLVARARRTRLARRVYEPILRHAMGGVGIKERLDRLRGSRPAYDLYHSLGSLHAAAEPWVVSPESVLDFFGFGMDWHEEIRRASSRRYVVRKLLSSHCRRILPWNEASRRSIETTFPDEWKRLSEKTEVMPLAIRPGPEPKPPARNGPLQVLFVGSRNFPQDFVPKGGHVVLEAFRQLREKRDDVELTIRARVPDPLRARHEQTPGLRIVDAFLGDEEMADLYAQAHVFAFPAAYTPGMVIPEAMRAGVPCVAFDVWANAETVRHGETGLVLPPPDEVPYLTPFGYPCWSHEPAWISLWTRQSEQAAPRLVEAIARLADDEPLRRRMAVAARHEVTKGRFSVERRNRTLERVYREALGR